jgi:mannose-6-phosphate isomerase-like protein (cupin superfamily)
MADRTDDFTIVEADQVRDSYESTDVPGEFRRLTDALGCTQVAATLIRIPPHSDFEQGTGHTHDEIEELYLVARGELRMRFDNEIRDVSAGSIVRVAPGTARSHRNEGDEPVELWAFSAMTEGDPGNKIDDFWDASPQARQRVEPG